MTVEDNRWPGLPGTFAPIVLRDGESQAWSMEADAVVAGFGIAGACAALELAEAGLEVAVLDRFEGGGASALSGGVYYGGGTRHQQEAGFDDDPEEMFRYLKMQCDGAVTDETLRDFCKESSASLAWLERHGARFSGAFFPGKTSYPPEGHFLYFSGNERLPDYARVARPAPRGHKALGEGLTGRLLWGALRASAEAQGVRLLWQSRVRKLIVNGEGTVIGVEVAALAGGSLAARIHRFVVRRFNASMVRMTGGPIAMAARSLLLLVERLFARPLRIRARRGVVIATGGFVYNRAMVRKHSPRYRRSLPLGTLSCDGSGIGLAAGAGAAIREIGNMDASRLIAPPLSFLQGIVVDKAGRRFISEDAYTATIGRAINQRPDGQAHLVIPKRFRRDVWNTLRKPSNMLELLWTLRMFTSSYLAARSSATLDGIARSCGIDPAGLAGTMEDYARNLQAGVDPLGKAPENLADIRSGPFLAIDVSSDSLWNPATTFSLGGIDVDERTGRVRRPSGEPVAGLFAAGRAAFGIPSRSYVSGLSIADCVFSGRRAGKAMASAG